MLSQILLRVASMRFWKLLSIYILVLSIFIILGAVVLGISYNIHRVNYAQMNITNFIIESAANTLGFGEISNNGHFKAYNIIALCQGFLGILVNGIFVALLVFHAIRINHRALLFANQVLLSQQADGKWRLEFRICNNSRYDIVNVEVKIQLVEYLESFPKTTAHKTSKVILNYDEYLFLPSHGYLMLTSAPVDSRRKTGERIAKINGSLLDSRFFLRILVQGQYVDSGLSLSEFYVYQDNSVHKGYWRYYLKEDLEKRGRILIEEFSAFDPKR